MEPRTFPLRLMPQGNGLCKPYDFLDRAGEYGVQHRKAGAWIRAEEAGPAGCAGGPAQLAVDLRGPDRFLRRYSEGRQPIHFVKALEKTKGL